MPWALLSQLPMPADGAGPSYSYIVGLLISAIGALCAFIGALCGYITRMIRRQEKRDEVWRENMLRLASQNGKHSSLLEQTPATLERLDATLQTLVGQSHESRQLCKIQMETMQNFVKGLSSRSSKG